MVTLKTVALAAQVSPSTASAVLGNRAGELGIKEETCQRVFRAASRLRYRKNEIAAQMKSSKANMVALFVPPVGMGEITFQVSVGAGQEAEKFNCFLKTVITDSGDAFRRQLDYTLGQCPAALLYYGDPGEQREMLFDAAQECRLPLTFLDFQEHSPGGSVLSDDRAGIREAVRHLHELGHRNILHLTDPLKAQYAATRYAAFEETMRELGLPIRTDNVFCGHRDPAKYREMNRVLEAIFRSSDMPTAIACGSDYFALHAMTLLQSLHIRVPEEVSIIGFGDLSFAQACSPQLSTVRQPFREIGSRAVRMALADGFREEAASPLLLPTELIRRASTCSVNRNFISGQAISEAVPRNIASGPAWPASEPDAKIAGKQNI